MIITQDQLTERLNSNGNILNQDTNIPNVEVKKWQGGNGGRTEGATELSHEERVAIGVIANIDGPTVASKVFDVSISHASKIKNDRSDIADTEQLQKEIKERVLTTEERVAEIAAEKLLTTLGFINDEKLMNCNAKDASSVAANLSKVAMNMRGGSSRDKGSQGPQVLIVLNQPKPAREEHFDSIEVSA